MTTVAKFRLQFPEFSNQEKYPDPMVTVWLNVATQLVNAERWGNLTDLGVNLLLAHFVVLAARSHDQADGGKIPGQVNGVLSSKSADGLSASYDVSSIMVEGAGDFNLTSYGIRFVKMGRMMGMGPLHIGTGTSTENNVSAWQGVIFPY